MKECPPDESRVGRELLAYLSNLPGREDTLAGIMRKLLPERFSGRQRTLLQEVLGDLVTQGLIERRTIDDGPGYRVRLRRGKDREATASGAILREENRR